jgi:hypothetical protein
LAVFLKIFALVDFIEQRVGKATNQKRSNDLSDKKFGKKLKSVAIGGLNYIVN